MFLKFSKSVISLVRRQFSVGEMAKSKFEYVKSFELEDKVLQNCWIVVRVDGQHFHKFSEKHSFEKPNDLRALKLMNKAAIRVMCEFKDILISYGQSDEYSFILRKDSQLYNRRASKITTYINSLFSSSYVYYWNEYFGEKKLLYPPSFDSRIVLYPTDQNLRDYLSWRQADCHINNLYNTTFWTLIQKGGLTNTEAEQKLCGTFSSDKNEILFTDFGINYNDEAEIYKKGTILLRKKVKNPRSGKMRQAVLPLHIDLIGDKFWKEHTEILEITTPGAYNWVGDLPKEVLVQLHIYEDCEEEKTKEEINVG